MILALLAIPLIAALVGASLPRERQALIEYGTLVASGLTTLLALVIGWSVLSSGPLPGPGFLGVDALGAFGILVTAFVGFAAAIHSVGHLREEARKGIIGFRRVREYYSLFHLFIFSMLAASASESPIIT